MKINRKLFIFAMALVLGLFLLPGLTRAAIVGPDLYAGATAGEWEFSGTESPMTGVSPDGQTGVKVGYTPNFIETWVDGSVEGANASAIATWLADNGDNIPVTLTFDYLADSGASVSWFSDASVGEEYGISDGKTHSVTLTFNMYQADGDYDHYMFQLNVSNNGGQAVISNLQGLPLPSSQTPLPGSLLLLGTGLAGLGAVGRRRRKA